MSGSAWDVRASVVAHRTSNPIRKIVDQLKIDPHSEKAMIPLSIGDPTVFGNFDAPEAMLDSVKTALYSGKCNGYAHSCGYAEARKTIAERFSIAGRPKLTAEDVVLASGCSGALDMAITVLANEGDNILLPQPGFSLYKTLCDSKGIEVRLYRLLPEKEWEADVDHMRTLIDRRTRAILVNNPSNPCGCVYSAEHLKSILALAEENFVPVIADEIYADMVFSGATFHPMPSLTSTVPILQVGGIAKQFLVPGWRVGWIVVHDPIGAFADVRKGLLALSTLILGPNTLVQGALPDIFKHVPKSFYSELNHKLERHADFSVRRLRDLPGLNVITPRGAMYLMVQILPGVFADIADDVEFSQRLIAEESVMVLPGQCFGAPNFFRIVFCPPLEKLEEAYDRIEAFCRRHARV
jgi:tyrosine aminotransferase